MTKDYVDQEKARVQQDGVDDTEYPSTKKLLPITGAIWLAFFVVALVRITGTYTQDGTNAVTRIAQSLAQLYRLSPNNLTASGT